MGYLDNAGLARVWSKVKAPISALSTRLAALEEKMWAEVGSASGTAAVTIPTAVWDKASEFLIAWRLTDDAPWRTMIVPRSPTRSLYVDSYQYSATYWGCFGFSVGLLNGSYPVTPATGWTAGAWGSTALNVNDLRYMLYWK